MRPNPFSHWLEHLREQSDDDFEVLRKSVFATFLLLPAVPLFLVFGALDWIKGSAVEAVLEVAFAAVAAASLVVIPRLEHPGLLYRGVILAFGVQIVLWASTGADGGVELMWAFVFPLASMFAVGVREGLVWNLATLAAFALFMLPASPLAVPYPPGFAARYLLSFAVVVLVASLYESIRTQFYRSMLAERGRLVAERAALSEAHDRIERLSVIDALTGVHNRSYLNRRLPEEVVRVSRYGRSLALVLCDLDGFKSVNDTHGHLCGDLLLERVARALEGELRESVDWVARYGGEEFLVVLPETELAGARAVAERLRSRVEQLTVEWNGQRVGTSASFGVASLAPGEVAAMDVDALLDVADRCLYAAKRAGRNRVACTEPP